MHLINKIHNRLECIMIYCIIEVEHIEKNLSFMKCIVDVIYIVFIQKSKRRKRCTL